MDFLINKFDEEMKYNNGEKIKEFLDGKTIYYKKIKYKIIDPKCCRSRQ